MFLKSKTISQITPDFFIVKCQVLVSVNIGEKKLCLKLYSYKFQGKNNLGETVRRNTKISGTALEEIHVNTYLLKHGEDGSLKCLYGFTLDREPIQSQQKYCMQPVHVILLQPSSFWQGKETRNSSNRILPHQSSGLSLNGNSPQKCIS